MKRILINILMAAGITGPFVAHLAAEGNGVAADIPFAFVANNQTMPAGHYELSQGTSSRTLFQLRNVDGKSVFAQLGIRELPKTNAGSLTFACYGKECVLAKVTLPGGVAAFTTDRKWIEKNLHHSVGMASMISVKLGAR